MEKNRPYKTVRGYQLESKKSGELTSALEDYLEMTYRLCSEKGHARVSELAETLGVRPPSVSKMITKLAELGYIDSEPYDRIRLTPAGKEKGSFLYWRHETVARFLRLIGSKSLLEETELIEHALSPHTVRQLRALVEFFERDEALLRHLDSFRQKYRLKGMGGMP